MAAGCLLLCPAGHWHGPDGGIRGSIPGSGRGNGRGLLTALPGGSGNPDLPRLPLPAPPGGLCLVPVYGEFPATIRLAPPRGCFRGPESPDSAISFAFSLTSASLPGQSSPETAVGLPPALPSGSLPGQWLETAVHFDNSVSLRYNYGDTNQIVLEPLRYDQATDVKGDRP